MVLQLLLRRRWLRLSDGLAGLNPLARAWRFRISVRLTTPNSRPDRRAPGSADAGIDVASPPDVSGMGRYGLLLDVDWLGLGDIGGVPVVLDPVLPGTRCVAEWDGVGGPEDDGDIGSVTHNLYNVRPSSDF